MKVVKRNIWFWSDPHFYHKNIIRLCDRPFKDLEEMHETLIRNYNQCVGPDDVCVWVGDCFFASGTRARNIMERLNGKKILVLGNHDKGPEGMMNMGFDWACYEMWLLISGEPVQVKHYPMLPTRWELNCPWWKKLIIKVEDELRYAERRPKNKGQFLIHGHTHQKDTFRGKQIHVGVDSNNFRPISLGQIEKYIREY